MWDSGSGLLVEKRRGICGRIRYGIVMISFSEQWGGELGCLDSEYLPT